MSNYLILDGEILWFFFPSLYYLQVFYDQELKEYSVFSEYAVYFASKLHLNNKLDLWLKCLHLNSVNI